MSYGLVSNDSRTYECERLHPNYFEIEQIGLVYIQTTVCVIGIILFSIITAVFCQKKKFNSTTYHFMKVVAIVNLFTMILRVPQGLSTCLWEWCLKDFKMYLYIYTVYIEFPLTNITETMSCWLTMAIVLERAISMKDFSLSKAYCGLQSAHTYCYCLIIAAVFLNSPLFFLQRVYFVFDEELQRDTLLSNQTVLMTSDFYFVYSWVRLVIVQFLPLVFLIAGSVVLILLVSVHTKRFNKGRGSSNTTLLENIRKSQASVTSNLPAAPDSEKSPINPTANDNLVKHKKSSSVAAPSSSTSANRRQRAQMKLTILIIITIILFLIGQIPQAFAYRQVYYTLRGRLDCVYGVFFMCAQNLTLICYCATFFVYLFLNTHFRETLCSWIAPLCPGLFLHCARAQREGWIPENVQGNKSQKSERNMNMRNLKNVRV